MMMDLDIDLLRSFAAIADTRSFTAAGTRIGATQSAVSVRLKKLEERIGRTLLERTPRSVMLTPFGETFLADARRILAAHDDALRRALVGEPAITLSVGISEHAGGLSLAPALAELRRLVPNLQLRIFLGLSDDLLAAFQNGRHDAVIIRRNTGPTDGRVLYRDDLCWFAAPSLGWRPGEPVPLVTLESPCNARMAAIGALEGAGLAYLEAFLSRGVAAIQAATSAGLGIACLGARHRPDGTSRLGEEHGLPPLPLSEVVLHHRLKDKAAAFALDRLGDVLSAASPSPLTP